MKKTFLALILGTVLALSAVAQDGSSLKPFKCDVSLGYAIPGGSGAKGGIIFAVEPKYSVISRLAVGLRLEGAAMARFSGYDENGDVESASVKLSSSYLATGDYYLTDNYKVHPFVGAGAGIFLLASAEANSSGSSGGSAGSKFGGLVRAGIELSHFRLGLEYNIIPKTTFAGYNNDGDYTTGLTSKNSYIGIKIGACIGGGPR